MIIAGKRSLKTKTAADVQDSLGKIFNALNRDEMSPTKARALAAVGQVILKANEQGELQSRIEQLEAQLKGPADDGEPQDTPG